MTHTGNVVVVEDDLAIGLFVAEALGDDGYCVRVVTNATVARAAISAQLPDLVLCDLHLEGVSSSDLFAELRQTLPDDVSIVMMTADAQGAQRLNVPGIRHCLLKPFDLDQLLDCVAAYIRH